MFLKVSLLFFLNGDFFEFFPSDFWFYPIEFLLKLFLFLIIFFNLFYYYSSLLFIYFFVFSLFISFPMIRIQIHYIIFPDHHWHQNLNNIIASLSYFLITTY